MKLIELLARELKEWADTTLCYVQDSNGDVWPCKAEPELQGRSWESKSPNPFIDQSFAAVAFGARKQCEDWSTAIITREDWDVYHASATVTTPTLETMLAEWRDLEARAQAAQAEADALFEHAGQCHGEIVVRLAELGWGAPRGPMVPGEPVVTLDDSDGWIEWKGGEVPVPEGTVVDLKTRDGDTVYESVVGESGNNTWYQFWSHDGDNREIMAYRLTPSKQP